MKIQTRTNDIHFIGHAARDAEKRVTQNHKTLAEFSVAVGRDTKRDPQRDSKRDSSTVFYKCAVWEGSPDFDEALTIRKGDKVRIDGSVFTREYTDRDGNPRESLEARVEWLDVRHKSPHKEPSPIYQDYGEDEIPF